MFNSLVPNGEIYLSLIYIQQEDNRHVIPWRQRNQNNMQRDKTNHLSHDLQIDPWSLIDYSLNPRSFVRFEEENQ